MSSERANAARRLYEDPTSEAPFEVYDSEIEWDMSGYEGWPGTPVFTGHDGVREFMREWLSVWHRWQPTVEEVVDAGDRIVLTIHDSAWGTASGTPVERRFWHVYTFRGDRIVRSEICSDRDEAMARAGVGAG